MPFCRKSLRCLPTPKNPTGHAVAVPGPANAMSTATSCSFEREAFDEHDCPDEHSDDEMSRPAKKRKMTADADIRCLPEKNHDTLSCLTCGMLFTDKSPLPEKGIYGKYYPWGKYSWLQDNFGIWFRYPQQSNCAPCRNTFGNLGYDKHLNMTLSRYNREIHNKTSHAAQMHIFYPIIARDDR